jgi:hypothetical protein
MAVAQPESCGESASAQQWLGYRLDDPGFESGRGKKPLYSRELPDELWGPPSLPSGGHRGFFLGVKWPGPVKSDNSIEEEIQHRITLRNKAYYANQFFFKSRLVSKISKLKLYWSIIRPVVTYTCET